MLGVLPQEVTGFIVTHFDDLETAFHFSTVSYKHFQVTHNAIARHSRLTSLFLTRMFATLMPQQMRVLLKRFSPGRYTTPYTIQLTRYGLHYIPLIERIRAVFPRLQKMEVDTTISSRELCTFLEDEQLESLHLFRLTNIAQNIYLQIFISPRLRSLKLCHTGINDEALGLILARCRSLVSLTLVSARQITSRPFSEHALPLLDTLTCQELELDDSGLEQVLESLPSCTQLTLRSCNKITLEGLARWSRAAFLRSLFLSSAAADENNLAEFFYRCRALRELHLDRCVQLTPSFFSTAPYPASLLVCRISCCAVDLFGLARLVHCCSLLEEVECDVHPIEREDGLGEVTTMLSKLRL